jgi:hypothetical protein
MLVAGGDHVGGADQPPVFGATKRFAKARPIHTDDSSTVSAITVYISAKAIWMPWRRVFEIRPLGDAGLGLRQHLRIDEARDIERAA